MSGQPQPKRTVFSPGGILLSLVMLPSLAAAQGDIVCSGYAKTALAQRAQAVTHGCSGIQGNLWDPSSSAHWNWCMQPNVTREMLIEETMKRFKLLQQCGVTSPAGLAPSISIGLDELVCLEETDEVGADEPYVLVTAIDLGPLVPNAEVVLYGPFSDVDKGEKPHTLSEEEYSKVKYLETIGFDFSTIRKHPFWGLDGSAKKIADPDDVVFIVSMMENDDGDPSAARSIVKGAAVASLGASIGMSREDRVKKIVQDIHGILGTPTGAPNFDDKIGTQELRLDFSDLLGNLLGRSDKMLVFEGDGGRYTASFQFDRTLN